MMRSNENEQSVRNRPAWGQPKGDICLICCFLFAWGCNSPFRNSRRHVGTIHNTLHFKNRK